MANEPENLESCTVCGASVYPEHIDRGLAVRVDGRLICIHCKREQPESGQPLMGEPIDLVAEEDVAPSTLTGGVVYERKATAIKSFGGGPGAMTAGSTHESKLRRPLDPLAATATRCRTFHCKLADFAFANLNDQINEWADNNDSVRIKFVSSCIGVVEGKHADPHLIVTVFY